MSDLLDSLVEKADRVAEDAFGDGYIQALLDVAEELERGTFPLTLNEWQAKVERHVSSRRARRKEMVS